MVNCPNCQLHIYVKDLSIVRHWSFARHMLARHVHLYRPLLFNTRFSRFRAREPSQSMNRARTDYQAKEPAAKKPAVNHSVQVSFYSIYCFTNILFLFVYVFNWSLNFTLKCPKALLRLILAVCGLYTNIHLTNDWQLINLARFISSHSRSASM